MKKIACLLFFLIFILGCESSNNNLYNQINNPVVVEENVSTVHDSVRPDPVIEPSVKEEVVQPNEIIEENIQLGQNLTEQEINSFIRSHPKGDYTVYITGSDLEFLTFQEAANLYEINVQVFMDEMISRFNIKKDITPEDKIYTIGVYYKPREIKDLAERLKLENAN